MADGTGVDMLGDWEVDTVVHTDALSLLRGLPDNSVNCCVTSPPYFGLRDYGVDGQIGLENSPTEYVAALVEVFREVRRVLRPDGVLFLNLGDSYAGAGYSNHAGTNGVQRDEGGKQKHTYGTGLKNKDLIGIPWMVAFALRADGWYLRSEIIWHKPNCMPESVTDRPTKAHEYLFLLTKTASYFYDSEAIKENALSSNPNHEHYRVNGKSDSRTKHIGVKGVKPGFGDGGLKQFTSRNKRSVWTINTQPFPGAHFAVMPEALVEPCILAGCPVGGVVFDPFFGAGTVGVVAQRLGRHWLGSDINAEYVELARARIAGRFEEYQAVKAGEPTTAYMFAVSPPAPP